MTTVTRKKNPMTIRHLIRDFRAFRAARKAVMLPDLPTLTPEQDAALAALAPDVASEVEAEMEAAIQARIDKARDEDIWALANAVGLDHRVDRLFLESALDTGVVPTQHARHLVVVP